MHCQCDVFEAIYASPPEYLLKVTAVEEEEEHSVFVSPSTIFSLLFISQLFAICPLSALSGIALAVIAAPAHAHAPIKAAIVVRIYINLV
eukprot:13987431-Ditylum_brightwellii.AAC.1